MVSVVTQLPPQTCIMVPLLLRLEPGSFVRPSVVCYTACPVRYTELSVSTALRNAY